MTAVNAIKTSRALLFLMAAVIAGGACSNSHKEEHKILCTQVDFSVFTERSFASYLEGNKKSITIVPLDSSVIMDVYRGLSREDGSFLLSDRRMRRLLAVSSINGYYLGDVGRFGRAENEYLQVTGFDRDKNGNIWVLDARGKSLLEYDGSTYAFKAKKKLEFTALDIKCLENGGFLFFLFPYTEGSTKGYQLMKTDADLKPLEYLLPYSDNLDANSLLMTRSFNAGPSGSVVSANMYIDDYVTVLDGKGTIMNQFEFNFGKYRIPDDIRASISLHAEEFIHFRSICAPVLIQDSWVCGQLFNKGVYSFFLADRKERILYIPEETPELISLVECSSGKMVLLLHAAPGNPYASALGLAEAASDYLIIIEEAISDK